MADNRGKKLTPLQAEFLRHYLLSRNATQSMKKAGYKSKNPDVDGPQLLKQPLIKAAIAAAEAKAAEQFGIDQEEILKELSLMAFANMGDVLDWDKDGVVTLKPKNKMSARGLAFIDSIKCERGFETVIDKDGNETLESYVKDIKITSLGKEKRHALKLLGQHIGMWKENGGDKPTEPGTPETPRSTSLARLCEILRKPRE